MFGDDSFNIVLACQPEQSLALVLDVAHSTAIGSLQKARATAEGTHRSLHLQMPVFLRPTHRSVLGFFVETRAALPSPKGAALTFYEGRNEQEQTPRILIGPIVRNHQEGAPILTGQFFFLPIIAVIVGTIVLLTVDLDEVRCGTSGENGRAENEVVAQSPAKPRTAVVTVIGTKRKPFAQPDKLFFYFPFVVRLSRCPSMYPLIMGTGQRMSRARIAQLNFESDCVSALIMASNRSYRDLTASILLPAVRLSVTDRLRRYRASGGSPCCHCARCQRMIMDRMFIAWRPEDVFHSLILTGSRSSDSSY